MSEKEIQKIKAELDAVFEGLSFILSKIEEIEKVYEQGQSEIWIWDCDKVQWVQDEGARGPYERADPQGLNGSDFDLMLKDLKAHNGRLTRDGFFYWVFQDQARVGRKKSK